MRFLVFWLALPAVWCATGCDGPSHTPDRARSSPTSTPTPVSTTTSAATPTSDADLCAALVTHWSRKALDGGTYGDYQSMGLSHGQYQILRDVVDAARSVKRRQGREAADELIDRQAHRACTERYRRGTPSGGPWT
ncbi:hypothetical protein KBP30_29780 [Streptomyces sp. Go40/10]|uniref:hypothetical protein n=1 Tax=Streptomyces sp. Go40/10 TaxID=2825844 RepID=UPI001E4EB173|nr:hypothetical protein [Streptomyces sp. Go40/10]UFR07661.1 hypothetical protein KBP30_29780 [Streptomyces sp. Go40/10]